MIGPKDRGKSYLQQVLETLVVMAVLTGLFGALGAWSQKLCR